MARSKKSKNKKRSYAPKINKFRRRNNLANRRLHSKKNYYKQTERKPLTNKKTQTNKHKDFQFKKVAQVQNKYIPFNATLYYSQDNNRFVLKTCRRRLQRPSILHALNKIGSGKKVKKPNYTQRSQIKC